MTPDAQMWFTVLLGLVAFFGGIVVSDQRRELRELKLIISTLPEKYVMRVEYKEFQQAILKKLDRIEDKMDGKADKSTREREDA